MLVVQVTRTTAVGFGFSLSPCAPPCSSSGCWFSASTSFPATEIHCPALCYQSTSLAVLYHSQGARTACLCLCSRAAAEGDLGRWSHSPAPKHNSHLARVGLIQSLVRMAKCGWECGASQLQRTKHWRFKDFLSRSGCEANLRQDLPLERNLIPFVL